LRLAPLDRQRATQGLNTVGKAVETSPEYALPRTAAVVLHFKTG
jgi:hypothetical protein